VKAGSAPLRIVSIGGGNGLSTLLRGLKQFVKAGHSIELTAVVAVMDDGGSSGRLRRDFEVLPPGDVRNCMVALARDETLMTRLFQYRFSGGRGLKGHSFGNLFLTAMTHLTGDFSHAIEASAQVLPVLGQIYPATASDVVLQATLADGSKVQGETRISRSRSRIDLINLEPRNPKPLPGVLKAIAEADLITLGPGSLFTSVIPNLLVDGIPQALAASRALKAYFVNLMSQPGETNDLRASDHLAAILRHCGKYSRPVVDVCVVNSSPIRGRVLGRYQERTAQPVANDLENVKALGLEIVSADLLGMTKAPTGEKIRHDPAAIGAVAFELARRSQKHKLQKHKRKLKKVH
jgi:uncharacterized cofD-like protein